MSHPILQKVQTFLEQAGHRSVKVSDDLIEEFGEVCKSAIRKQFTEERGGKFRLRMSNIGRPLCQLQMEKTGAPAETPDYSFKMKVLFGDLIEASAMLILKASGVDVQSEQKAVTHSGEIKGTYDVEIDNKIWDIKSASPFAFDKKFAQGFNTVVEDDAFGYASQGFMYADSEDKDFGGWIVINKASGEWVVCEAPELQEEDKKEALALAEKNLKALLNGEKFKRCFTDVEETYKDKDKNVKKTGNRVLSSICGFCDFKRTCWPDAIMHKKVGSTARFPKSVWYSKLKKREI